jgi:secreted trypsin-like serine protease
MTFVTRLVCGLVTAFAVVALQVMPASAIVGGTLDSTNIFKNVGLITLDGQHWCSGTLYHLSPSQTSSNLFMTAAHCIQGFTGNYEVTFDPAGDTNPSATYVHGTAYYIPGYTAAAQGNSLNQNNVPDVGVIVLDHAVSGLPMADLPSVGEVDSLDFNTQLLTAVGYGTADPKANTYGPRYYLDEAITPGQRTQSGVYYLKTGSGTCYGDSGGPNFIKGSDTILGVTSWGQSVVCQDHNYFYRIDSNYALNFLNSPTTVGIQQ